MMVLHTRKADINTKALESPTPLKLVEMCHLIYMMGVPV
jgi:hypothetical protein